MSKHALASVPLTSLALLDAGALVAESTTRFDVRYRYRPDCDVPGQIDVGVNPATSTISFTAHLWKGAASDCGPSVEARHVVPVRVASLLPDASVVQAVDGVAPSSPLTLVYGHVVAVCQKQALGEFCSQDCDCPTERGAVCIETGMGGICAVSCDEDAQCVGIGICGSNGLPSTCIQGVSCQTDGDCGFGKRCSGGGVGDQPSTGCYPDKVPAATAFECQCDSDCGFGYLCGFVNDTVTLCQEACATTADCPGTHQGCGGLFCESSRCIATVCDER